MVPISPAEAAPVFAALGDRTRLSLVIRLSSGGTASIAQLASETSLTRQAVTKHLKVLEDADLVSCAREGREARYRVRTATLTGARETLAAIAARWDDALDRLKSLVED